MKRKRAGLGGPVMALRDASPQAMHHFTRFRSCPAGTASSFGPVPGVEAMSCRCGGKHSEFCEFCEVPSRARALARASRKPAKTKYRGSPSQALIRRPAAGTENLTKPAIAAGYHLVYAFPRDAPPFQRRTWKRANSGPRITSSRLEIFVDRACFGDGPGAVPGDHARAPPSPGQHDFLQAGPACGEFGGEADPA